MKPILFLLCLFALGASAPELPTGAVGRYQIITGRSYSLGLEGGKPMGNEQAVTLRLDTMTGRTWSLVLLNVEGKTRDTWIPIPEYEKPSQSPR